MLFCDTKQCEYEGLVKFVEYVEYTLTLNMKANLLVGALYFGSRTSDKKQDKTARFLNASVDWALNPCDDFYKFACSRWKGRHHVPSHRDERSLFTVLRRALDMDVLGQVNRLGVAPVSRLLERHGLSGWPASLPRSLPEPALLVGELTRRLRLQPLFTTTVSVHPKDVTRRMVHVKKKYALFNDRLLEAVRKARWIHAKSSQVIQQR
ncbi:hypothetical protein V5799_015568, partial [Amblyomma americanum]